VNLLEERGTIPSVIGFDKLTRSLGRRWRHALLGILALCAAAAIFTSPSQRAEAHETGICANKHWCEQRSHTCGPVGGYGKCLLTRFGKNLCAEILFQTANCSDCAAPNCTDCVCAVATGADKCNNGANGYPYICVRRVAQ